MSDSVHNYLLIVMGLQEFCLLGEPNHKTWLGLTMGIYRSVGQVAGEYFLKGYRCRLQFKYCCLGVSGQRKAHTVAFHPSRLTITHIYCTYTDSFALYTSMYLSYIHMHKVYTDKVCIHKVTLSLCSA